MGFLSMKESRSARPKIAITGNMIESPFHRPFAKVSTPAATNSNPGQSNTPTATSVSTSSANSTIGQLVNLSMSAPLNQRPDKVNIIMPPPPPPPKSTTPLRSKDNNRQSESEQKYFLTIQCR